MISEGGEAVAKKKLILTKKIWKLKWNFSADNSSEFAFMKN